MSPLPSSCSAPCSPRMVRESIFAGDLETDPGRQIGLDDAGDDVDRRPLGRHDQVDAGGTRFLREPLDEEFDFLAGGHHQVRELVDDHDDLRQQLDSSSSSHRSAGRCRHHSRSAPAARAAAPLALASRTFALKLAIGGRRGSPSCDSAPPSVRRSI